MLDLMDIARIILESVSALLCFILVWFMAKPYKTTGDARLLGLPLGFGIMGISHIIATVVTFSLNLSWFMLMFRTFSFVFLATVYFFASKSSKKTQQLWNITVSATVVILITSSLLIFVAPEALLVDNSNMQVYFRVFMLVALCYIIAQSIRTHVEKPDPMTIWIPFGFVFLAISQYSFLLFYVDFNLVTFWSAMAFRFAGLAVFLFVAYQTFYRSKENE